MKRVLYIGHAFHLKTKSTQFFIDILEENFNVSFLWYDPFANKYTGFEVIDGQEFDFIVIFQVSSDSDFLNQHFKFERAIYIPMYDAVANLDGPYYPQFEPYRSFGIICFSKTLYDGLIERNYDAVYVQYFPEPESITNWGNTDSVFFWQRRNEINIRNVVKLLPNFPVKHIHIHKALDPTQSFTEPNVDSKYEYTYSEWFEDKQDMNRVLDESALYIAPRCLEGIGQSFLGAMARGRCVIAPDVPTMNEYIVHGKNGLLYDINNMKPLEKADIQSVQENAHETIKEGYEKWQKDKARLIDWLNNGNEKSKKNVVVVTNVKNIYKEHCINNFIKTLESVRMQSYKEIRHIIITPPSEDNTEHLVKKYLDAGWVEVYGPTEPVIAEEYRIELKVGNCFADSNVIHDFVNGVQVDNRIVSTDSTPVPSLENTEQQIASLKERNDKFTNYFKLLTKWLDAEIQHLDFCTYFKKHNIRTVAIYGMGRVGKLLYNKIKKTNSVSVAYAIDKSVPAFADLTVYKPADKLPAADCIIVTTGSIFYDIKKQLESINSMPIICIDEIINEAT